MAPKNLGASLLCYVIVVISFLFVLGTKGRVQPVVMAPGFVALSCSALCLAQRQYLARDTSTQKG